ncbi:MAG TPA: 2,4'-dihydroxyacetophenone dioxygenase family protein [Noviherbaspirillum sp.]|nr:2,4'-dihydroxyacetophenone dioxygenase family protein [Noviherbaspirillum sp.]
MTNLTQPSTNDFNRTDHEVHVRDPLHLPWVPWAMPDAHFKLLSGDPESGRFTLMIRLGKNCNAPLHRHVGAVEGLVLEGGFHYEENPEQRYTAGMYLLEPAGCIHQPVSPEGALMFAVFHGPIEGLDNKGNVTGRVGCEWHIATWNAALAHHTL